MTLRALTFLPRLLRRLRRPPQTWMEADVLKTRLENGDDLIVIDVRGPDEYNGPLGHIPASRNIPLDELVVRIEELKPLRERTIVMVCKTDKRSAKGALLLQENGFSNVAIARGGMERWNSQSATGSVP